MVLTSPTSLIPSIFSKITDLNSNGASGAIFYVFSHDGFTLRAASKLATPNLRGSRPPALRQLTLSRTPRRPDRVPISGESNRTSAFRSGRADSFDIEQIRSLISKGRSAAESASRAIVNPGSTSTKKSSITAIAIFDSGHRGSRNQGGLARIWFDVKPTGNRINLAHQPRRKP